MQSSILLCLFLWVVYLKGEMRRFVKKLLHALLEILRNPQPMNLKKHLKNQNGKLIWFTRIDGLQGLLGLNLFVKGWQDEDGEV